MDQTRASKKRREREDDTLLLEEFVARAICDANAQRVRDSAKQICAMKKIPLQRLSAMVKKGDAIALYTLGAFLMAQTEDSEKTQRGMQYIEAAASMGVPQAQLSLAAYHIGMAATYGFALPRVLVETINAWEEKYGEVDQVLFVVGALPDGPVRKKGTVVPSPSKPLDKKLG